MFSKEKIEESKEHLKIIERNYTYNNHYSITDLQAIETLLQYIDRLEFQTQVKEKEHAYDLNMIDEVKGEAVKLYNKIDKLKKIINEMSKQLAGIAIWNNEKEEPIILKDEQEVKLYFERKAVEEI